MEFNFIQVKFFDRETCWEDERALKTQEKGEASNMNNAGELRFSLSRNKIAEVKTKALRRGIWYRALTKTERACIDLVIRVVDRVRSRLLRKVVSSVLRKLEEAMESRVQRLIQEIGSKFALKLSQIAQGWGSKYAECWAEDAGFKQYLTITYMNNPS
jgi:hypothetical protein